MKKLSIALFLLWGGCSSTHVNAPAPPRASFAPAPASAPAAPAPGSLIPRHAAVTVEEYDPAGTNGNPSPLDCAALNRLPHHGDTDHAFQNLNGSSRLSAVIVGEGTVGQLCTGDGQLCQSGATAMSASDAADWVSFANSIQGKRFTRLTVIGCLVGACEEGAEFVSRLAEETKTPVRATTGLVWCVNDTLKLDPDQPHGTYWIEVQPGESAQVEFCPPPLLPVTANYNLFIDGGWKLVPAHAVHVSKFSYEGFPPYKGGVVEAEEARSLLRFIGWGHPFKRHGRPLAAITGRIQLSVVLEGSHLVAKTLILYADSLVADPEAKDFYYRVDIRLHQRLRKLRLSGPRIHE